MDNDDEVRDRALLYLQVLRQKQKALSSAFILNRKLWVWQNSAVLIVVLSAYSSECVCDRIGEGFAAVLFPA